MIILINGPLGVGKSTVSWELLRAFERAVMLDGDYFAALQPFSIHRPADLDYVYQSMAHQLNFHFDNGYRNMIVNYVFEDEHAMQKLVLLLHHFQLPIFAFYLRCEAATCENRIRLRGNDQVEWETERSAALRLKMEEQAQQGSIGTIIDTTSCNPAEVVNAILTQLKNTEHGNN